jgi:hypothetical protein
MDIEAEIATYHHYAKEARRAILIARMLLRALVVSELLGSKWAHEKAESQRDIIGERRYAREEFLMNAGRYQALIDPGSRPRRVGSGFRLIPFGQKPRK